MVAIHQHFRISELLTSISVAIVPIADFRRLRLLKEQE